MMRIPHAAMLLTLLPALPATAGAQGRPTAIPREQATHPGNRLVDGTVQIVVQSVAKACLRITLPNGVTTSPCFLRGTDIGYTLGPFRSAKFCWARDAAPTKCDPTTTGTMTVGDTLRF